MRDAFRASQEEAVERRKEADAGVFFFLLVLPLCLLDCADGL